MLVGVKDSAQARRLVAPGDAHVAGGEDFAQLVADHVDDCLEVQLGNDRLLDAVDDRQLRVALLGFLEQPLRLVEQARVLQRDAERRGHRRQQAQLGLAIGVFALVVFHRQQAQHAVAADDRNCDARQALVGARHHHEAGGNLRCGRAEQLRLARSDEAPGRDRQLDRRQLQPFAVLVAVKELETVVGFVEPADADVPDAQHLPQLVAHQVDDRLEIQLLGHALLDAVDHRQLGAAALGLLQQSLRFGEKARVLQCRARAGGNGRQQPHVCVAIRMFARMALDRDHADQPIPGEDRRQYAREAHVRALGDEQFPVPVLVLRIPAHWLVRGQHAVVAPAFREIREGHCRDPDALAVLAAVRKMQHAARRVEPHDDQRGRVEHLPEPFAHRVVYALDIELAGQRLLNGVDDGELGRALALGLVALRVEQRHRHARGDRADEPHVGLREGVLALVVRERHAAENALAGHQRHGQKAQFGIRARYRRQPERILLGERVRQPHAALAPPGLTVLGGMFSRTPCS